MAVQLKNGENAVPLYEAVDKKATPDSKDYSMLSMSTLNKDGIYSGVATESVSSKEVKKTPKVTNYTRMVCYLATSAILVICFIAICATLFAEITTLKRENSRKEADLENRMQQLTMSREVSLEALNASTQINLTQYSELLNELQLFHLGQSKALPASSCAALKDNLGSSPSGHYWVRASNGSAVRVYCDMTRLCGGVTGGWTRVFEVDMTNSSHQCPRGFRQRTDAKKRTCVSYITPEIVVAITV
jgi:fluoride ion exporter CrcB/FEX